MRRLRNDLPYRFRPPNRRSWFVPFGRWANRRHFLQRTYQVASIEEEGFGKVKERVAKGDAVLLAPNHADHADPHVMMEIGARAGLDLHFMAAREVFEVGRVAAWALPAMGVFSVDRDGPDLSAIKAAIRLLDEGKPLVMYPEGEIYHHHERLDPLHDGVASIQIKVAGRLAEGRQAWLVPVGIRFRHDERVTATFEPRLARLEDRIGWTPRLGMPVDERIIRLGKGVLVLKEMEFLGEAGQGPIQPRLETLCDQLLDAVESRHGVDPRASTVPQRVRAQRYRIRQQLLAEHTTLEADTRSGLLDDLDRVFTALQAHSYIGDYLLEHPSLDRRAETLMKLEEDLLGFPTYPAPRAARVVAAEPIDVTALVDSGGLPRRGGAGVLTERLEAALNQLLKEL